MIYVLKGMVVFVIGAVVLIAFMYAYGFVIACFCALGEVIGRKLNFEYQEETPFENFFEIETLLMNIAVTFGIILVFLCLTVLGMAGSIWLIIMGGK